MTDTAKPRREKGTGRMATDYPASFQPRETGGYLVMGARVSPTTGRYITEQRPVCPVPSCGEYLGTYRTDEHGSAAWWAEKAINEHLAESHD